MDTIIIIRTQKPDSSYPEHIEDDNVRVRDLVADEEAVSAVVRLQEVLKAGAPLRPTGKG